MIRQLSEEPILLIHVLKWLLLAASIGMLVGMTSTGFVILLNVFIDILGTTSWTYWLLPVGLGLSAWITSSLVPEAGGQGVERVIRAIHLQSGKISWKVIPAKIAQPSSPSALEAQPGNVGPWVQIGSGVASFKADVFHCHALDRKTLVICGLSAGFASLFGTPLAGAFFGIEALFVGSLTYQVLLPSVVAALSGYLTSQLLGMPAMMFAASAFPVMNGTLLLLALVGGIVFGFCSLIFVECLNGCKTPHLCVACVAATSRDAWRMSSARNRVARLTGSPGIGKRHNSTSLGRGTIVWAVILGKILTTALTLKTGGRGSSYPSVLSRQPLDQPLVGFSVRIPSCLPH